MGWPPGSLAGTDPGPTPRLQARTDDRARARAAGCALSPTPSVLRWRPLLLQPGQTASRCLLPVGPQLAALPVSPPSQACQRLCILFTCIWGSKFASEMEFCSFLCIFLTVFS